MFASKSMVAAMLAVFCLISSPAMGGPDEHPAKKKSAAKKQAGKDAKDAGHAEAPALNFKVKDIDGKKVNLAKAYHGKVVMIVNVASKCGLTPQYEGLEALYEKYKDKDFVVLGFPANNYGGQEPGSNEKIKEFCTSKFSVTFPMFAKVSAKGDDICPLFKYLTGSDTGHKFGGEIKWNFNKFLVGRNGEVIGRFEPKVDPMSADVTSAIESAIEAPVPAEKNYNKTKASDKAQQGGDHKVKAEKKPKP